jgi:hypothetical protein
VRVYGGSPTSVSDPHIRIAEVVSAVVSLSTKRIAKADAQNVGFSALVGSKSRYRRIVRQRLLRTHVANQSVKKSAPIEVVGTVVSAVPLAVP